MMAGPQTYGSPPAPFDFAIHVAWNSAAVLTQHRKKVTEKNGITTAPAETVKNATRNLPFDDTTLVIGLTVLASVVRLWNINYPDSVVFDEVHFGGFASKYSIYACLRWQIDSSRYIKGSFFMDVHPPLAKMLIALVAWLAGFNGEFDFKDIGK